MKLQPGNPEELDVSPPVHEIEVEHHVKIPMRDGARLGAMIWRPKQPGAYPVIVERVGYELVERCSRNAEYLAMRGYVFVGQNVRGTYASEGGGDAESVSRDGYDTIEWAGTQPWSNGKVGMVDGSYSGFTQYVLAPTRPPHLTALFVREGIADRYFANFHGGAFQLSRRLGGTMRHILEDFLRHETGSPEMEKARARLEKAIAEEDVWKRHLPLKSCPLLKDIPYGRFYFEILDHPDYGPYWWQSSLSPKYAEVDVPTFHLGGWFDLFLDHTLRSFQGIKAHGRTAHCRDSQRLLIGPWVHSTQCTLHCQAGEMDFGPEAAFDLDAFRVRWYDYWLKGIDNGVMDGPIVRVFLMGESRWLGLETWPPEEVAYTPIYLREGTGRTETSLNNGTLTFVLPDVDERPDSFAYDPEDPVPSLISYSDTGPRDYRTLEGRILTYTSVPLDRDLAVIGPVRAVLHGLSSAPDTDWVVRLCDVYPDGRSMSVCDGILRARYRNSLERPELMVPGQIYRFEVDLWATAHSFKAGHCLRIHVTSSNFPWYDRNLNTGGPFGEEACGRIATNTILHDKMHPSHLILPVYPYREKGKGEKGGGKGERI
jgi:putative CocE/NonD family hydrolase